MLFVKKECKLEHTFFWIKYCLRVFKNTNLCIKIQDIDRSNFHMPNLFENN
ncbi:unnamed protein product [Moneuplotes crassus]|uniref:Uncharacterized protein n=1 Tax=Euplotes crassus TaxID=5936 RepID=A0AAD1UMG7_EUPCR|nr:unnamed protein product [Moneuplotes crassus]